MAQHPEVLWAQRSSESVEEKNVIYLTVNLPDIDESTLKYDLTSTSISFNATAGDAAKNVEEKNYGFNLDFFAEVDPEKSSKKLSSRSFYLVLRKKEKKSEYWPRLTKEKAKNPFVKTDFSKWVDEDEQDGVSNDHGFGDDDMDMSGLGGKGGDLDFEKMMADMK